MEKDAGLRIRIDRDLREKFLEICRAQDRPAAQVIREYMKDHEAGNGDFQELDKAQKFGSGNRGAE